LEYVPPRSWKQDTEVRKQFEPKPHTAHGDNGSRMVNIWSRKQMITFGATISMASIYSTVHHNMERPMI
jgi:hypothetical protein